MAIALGDRGRNADGKKRAGQGLAEFSVNRRKGFLMARWFERVCVIGVGLIGGSLAAACRALPEPPEVLGIDLDEAALAEALARGVIDRGALADAAIVREWLAPGGADLVVLAMPARGVEPWLALLGELGFPGVVTDVASTKAGVVAAARSRLPAATRFVGGHPMAGSERSGVTAARADLFRGANWLLTPAVDTDLDAFRRVHALVGAIGARVIVIPPELHDEAVAVVSHVPHVAAAALCAVAGARAGSGGELLRLAAGGFKDTTRIAAGSPVLWAGICNDNAVALAAGLRELRLALEGFEGLLRARDQAGIGAWLQAAAAVRSSLPAQWVPASTSLFELVIPVMDRPGVVAEVTAAVSRAGCNIEAIDLDHETEDRASLVLVLTDDGDAPRLVADLVARGYQPRLTPLAQVWPLSR